MTQLTDSSPEAIDAAVRAAAQPAPAWAASSGAERAALLRALAAALEGAREQLVPLADEQTGLGSGRLSGEIDRTAFQLRGFADLAERGEPFAHTDDAAVAGALPAGRPRLTRVRVPLGPVAMFSASNFRLPFRCWAATQRRRWPRAARWGSRRTRATRGCRATSCSWRNRPLPRRACRPACSSGAGGSPHLAAEMFKDASGVDILHVPYRGGGPAIADLLAGYVQVSFVTVLEAPGHIKSGKLPALAVTSDKRVSAQPDVPTLAESGLPGCNSISWIGLLAPRGTPPDLVEKISADVREIVARPEVNSRLVGQGAVPATNTPAEFANMIDNDRKRYARIIKERGITTE